jgi:hypothetical protein
MVRRMVKLNYYDKEKYREMILDAAETVLKFLGFDRTVYGMPRNNRKKRNGMTNCMRKEQKIFRQKYCNKVFRSCISMTWT